MAHNETHLIGLEGQYEIRKCESEYCNGTLTTHFVGVQHQVAELSGGTIDWTIEHADCCICHYTVHTTIHKLIIRKENK